VTHTFEDKICTGKNIIVIVRALYYVDENDALYLYWTGRKMELLHRNIEWSTITLGWSLCTVLFRGGKCSKCLPYTFDVHVINIINFTHIIITPMGLYGFNN